MKEIVLILFMAANVVACIVTYVKPHYQNQMAEMRQRHEAETHQQNKKLKEFTGSSVVLIEDRAVSIVRSKTEELKTLESLGIATIIPFSKMKFNRLVQIK